MGTNANILHHVVHTCTPVALARAALSAYWAARIARLPHAALKSVLVFTAVISLCAAGTFGIFIYTAVKEQTTQREEHMFIPLIELAGCTVFGFVAVLNALSVCCLSHREHDGVAAEPRLPKPRRGAAGKTIDKAAKAE